MTMFVLASQNMSKKHYRSPSLESLELENKLLQLLKDNKDIYTLEPHLVIQRNGKLRKGTFLELDSSNLAQELRKQNREIRGSMAVSQHLLSQEAQMKDLLKSTDDTSKKKKSHMKLTKFMKNCFCRF